VFTFFQKKKVGGIAKKVGSTQKTAKAATNNTARNFGLTLGSNRKITLNSWPEAASFRAAAA